MQQTGYALSKICYCRQGLQVTMALGKRSMDYIKNIFFFYSAYISYIEYNFRVIPCEITHSKNESLPIVFIRSTQSVHPMRFHNPEYQLPVTSCTNFVNQQKTGQLQLDITFLMIHLSILVSLDGSSKLTFFSKYVTRVIPNFLTQSRCITLWFII